MRIAKYWMPIAVIVTLLGTVYTAKAVGAWQTSGREMIDPTKPLSSADIRGWMPLAYLMERLDIPQDELYTLLGLPAGTPPSTPLKELEDVIEVSEVREVIAERLGETPRAHEEDTGEDKAVPTPEPTAADTATATPTATQPSTEGEHVPGSGAGTGPGPTPLPPGQVLPAAEIKGRMTLQEVSEQCAVPLDVLYRELDLPESVSANAVLRDLKDRMDGFEVRLVRDVVAAYQGR